MPLAQIEPVISSLVANAPIAAAVLATVTMFLKYLRERDTLFIQSQKTVADQLQGVAHEMGRIVDRLDRAEFRAGGVSSKQVL